MSETMQQPLRGEIWLVNWNPSRGSEQHGLRPSVIIQNDHGNTNKNFPNTIVTIISTKGKNIPFHIQLTPNETNKLHNTSYIKTEQILTISKQRLIKKIGSLTTEELEQINKSINIILNTTQ